MRLFIFCILAVMTLPLKQAAAQVTITQIQSLSFGSMIADPTGDTIRVRRNGSIRAQNGTILDGGHQPAMFEFNGPRNTSVSYSFSVGNVLSNGNTTISLENFNARPNSPFTIRRRPRILTIGADLIIPPSIQGGSYSGTYLIILDNQ